MKTIGLSLLAVVIFATIPLAAQAPDIEGQQLLNLVKELTAKQALLVDNEGKIEAKVTNLAESVRVARLFMSRAGGAHKPPPPPKK
jgi:hypothetical protein